MAKYDVNFKLAVVKDYLAGVGGYRTLAEKHTIDRSMVQKWVHVYNLFGRAGLERKKSKTTYSSQFKMDVVNWMKETGESTYEAAKQFKLYYPSMISRWLKEFEQVGAQVLLPKPKGRPKMTDNKQNNIKEMTRKELEYEAEKLRAELAFIKKLRA
ncbi:helix-turn-helix domain-containing protein, partial [Peribacillus psychrosaccharolyticus]|uniref:transposase n=1 Tax=Peribacillus psychrosaccharolyticus TaxID=1407 RepID=UPI003D2CD20D